MGGADKTFDWLITGGRGEGVGLLSSASRLLVPAPVFSLPGASCGLFLPNRSALENFRPPGMPLNYWRKGEGVGLLSSASRLLATAPVFSLPGASCALFLPNRSALEDFRPPGMPLNYWRKGEGVEPPGRRNGDRQVLKTCRATGPCPLPFG
ncbi:MAG: hypothetical protein A2X93_08820 [Deltaproteobacteria bacterium GWC2_56_8]|nr:MAG: hypothetical protein A2X99_07270 [Deltaproteobacteria bacterium GWB2_55_19]OGP33129.1 MAG: hypothetical protein A2X93_08820 [Deltaproteobacteria bacterium GWC2_56_8]HAO92341.1 hypothetical protein [Deltaproteobacteria bacterium]